MREFQIAKIYHRDEETAEVKNRFEIRELKVDWLGTILRVGMMGKWRKWKPLKWYRDYSGGVYSTPVQFSTLEEATEFLKRLETRIHVDEIVGGTRFPSQKCKTSPHCSHNTNGRDLSKPCSISVPDPVAEGECCRKCNHYTSLQTYCFNQNCPCHTPNEPQIEELKDELSRDDDVFGIDIKARDKLNEVIRALNRLQRK